MLGERYVSTFSSYYFLLLYNQVGVFRGIAHTSCGGILAKVLRLVLAPKSLGLNLRSRASGKLFVEIYYALHLGSIRRRPDGLNKENSQLLAFTSFHVFCFFLSLSRKLLPICWISARVCSRSH